MRPVIRYQSQLPARRSYKPARRHRSQPAARLSLTFRPAGPVVIRLVRSPNNTT